MTGKPLTITMSGFARLLKAADRAAALLPFWAIEEKAELRAALQPYALVEISQERLRCSAETPATTYKPAGRCERLVVPSRAYCRVHLRENSIDKGCEV